MKNGIIGVIIALLILGVFVPTTQAQYFRFNNIQADGNQTQKQRAELSVEAILKMFGTMVGSGQYQTAEMHSLLGFDVGMRGVLTTVPSEFEDLPVFLGDGEVGLAFLHASLGLPGKLELFGRFFYLPLGAESDPANLAPQNAADSRGGVTLIGGGLKYGLVQMPGTPKIMLMGTYHQLLVPDEFDFGNVGTLSLNAVISHSLAVLSIYAGAGVDITNLTVNDDSPLLPGQSFTENGFKYTLGAKASVLPFVHISGAMNFGEFTSFDLGLGISIR